ncbi:MAG: hypothetical protein Q8R92_07920 [Deltaproteobacteria bacterium]|nr:hypothetical protein [Deltaproteobacteria bacterium]
MDAIELRRRGVELLSPVLVPYGFVYQASEVDRGGGGLYAHGGSHERTVRWNSACAMRVDAATLLHEDFARAAVGRGQARYPGFSDDPLDGFRDLATDLVRFGSVFLAGTTAAFAALVTKAERTRPPRGFAALSPGHHPARPGLGAPQDATGAERCAVSVGPVDRMFATPPDSPGQCEPGLSDDRPRDPRFCYCPELSPRATRSSSS